MSWLLRGMLSLGAMLALQLEGQTAARSAGDEREGLTITALTYNYAPVDDAVLRKAEEQVTRIFHQIGVKVDWAGCPIRERTLADYPRCTGFHDPAHFSLHLLPRARKELRQVAQGEALLGPRLVNVFWDRAQEQANRHSVPSSDMLAAIICHEIGHLLLGPNSHAPLGIMMARWNPRALNYISQGGLGFTDEQQEHIRSELGMYHAR